MARPRELLIVDDDPAQVYIFRHLMQELGGGHRCHFAANGLEALEFLHRERAHRNAPRPELIILDLNMPGMNGCEVLVEIKRDPELRCIPVIMFSSSADQTDLSRCYSQGVNAYVQKPNDYVATLKVLEEIERFWFQTAILPPCAPATPAAH